MQFHPNIFGSRNLKKGEGFAFKDEGAVRSVLYHNEIILFREANKLFKEFNCSAGTCRVVGVVNDNGLGASKYISGDVA